MSKLFFLTVNYNSTSLIKRLVESLDNCSKDEYQIVIVNNSLEDKSIFSLSCNQIKIIDAEQNIGFGRACNLGLKWITKQNSKAIVWLINPDAYFDLDIFNPIASASSFFANNPSISILGTVVYDSKGRITSAGGSFTPGSAILSIIDSFPKDNQQDYLKTDWVSGCSLLINLANFDRLPQFDPRYFLYYEDLDFCLRYGQQGHQIAVTNLLRIIHDATSITNRNIFQKYKHITHSYLVHIENYGNYSTFLITNIRILLNTLRLLVIKPHEGLGKLTGFFDYWIKRIYSH